MLEKFWLTYRDNRGPGWLEQSDCPGFMLDQLYIIILLNIGYHYDVITISPNIM